MDAAAIRGRVEMLEDLVQRPAKVCFHNASDVSERLGWHMVAEQPELADELGREDPLARRQDLAELDVGRPEAFERFAEAVGQPGPGDFPAAQFVRPALFDQAPHKDRPTEPDTGDEHPPPRRDTAAAQ